MCKYPCPTSAQCWSVKIDKFQKDSARIEVKLWNKIPTDLPEKAFKRVLRKLLFDILQKKGDYIQIPMIIKKK